jgi:ElaB/YqjD/DUF883 family membrane-anchored ribosome-binding protein
METSSVDKLAKQGQSVAAKASDMAAGLRDDAFPILSRASTQARAAGKRGISAASDMASQVRDAATNASDSIITYTKKNPAKALAIAAVGGAVLFALAKANAMRRD